MRARLALAQALLPRPKLLILDEPSDGLDPQGIHEMRLTILRLQKELQLTILLSSHLLHEVEQLCTRIAVLNQGRMVFEGTLAATRQGPQWFRLKVDNFKVAAGVLRQAGLIEEERGDDSVALKAGAGSDQLVRCLVQANVAVYEIAQAQESLESFYLNLMNGEAKGN
jgi:ABC-2 type transport system ATP-binding protein